MTEPEKTKFVSATWRSAGFPACGFGRLSSRQERNWKVPPPADKNVCSTKILGASGYNIGFQTESYLWN
jgi:hypothetical protein